MPFVSRTLATLRRAEFGFFGVRVITCRQTPRRCGHDPSAGAFDFAFSWRRPLRTNWLIVGICQSVERHLPGDARSAKAITRSRATQVLLGSLLLNRGFLRLGLNSLFPRRLDWFGQRYQFHPAMLAKPGPGGDQVTH